MRRLFNDMYAKSELCSKYVISLSSFTMNIVHCRFYFFVQLIAIANQCPKILLINLWKIEISSLHFISLEKVRNVFDVLKRGSYNTWVDDDDDDDDND